MMIFKEGQNILLILVFLINVIDGSRNCTAPLRVASCPKNTHEWRQRAKNYCNNETDLYHCLVTQKDELVECCMTPEMVDAGQFPQYNTLNNKIQKIKCDIDYYMPSEQLSNKILNHGPRHCKYEKSKCNLMGMKICSDGNTTTDRTCKCDYMNKYVPEMNISTPCFDQIKSGCIPTKDCPGKNEEINMEYECVQVCDPGLYRPEGTMGCVVVPESTTQNTATNTDNTTKDLKDDMSSNMTYPKDFNTTVAILVAVVLAGIFALLIYFVKKGKLQDIACCSWIINNITAKNYQRGTGNTMCVEQVPLMIQAVKDKHKPKVGSSVDLKYMLGSGNSSSSGVEWFKDGKPIRILSTKYIETTNTSDPSLKINDITVHDTADYSCRVNGTDSVIIEVSVQEPVIKLQNSYNVSCGDNLTIGCEMKNFPDELSFEVCWKKRKEFRGQDQILEPSDKYGETYSGYPHLTINRICKEDEGYYSCWISYEICGRTFQVPDARTAIKSNLTTVNVNEGKVVQHFDKKIDVTVTNAGTVNMGDGVNANFPNSTGNCNDNKTSSGSSNPGGVSEKSSSSGNECSESVSNVSDSSKKGLIRSNADEKSAADTNNSGSTVGSNQMVNTNTSGLTAGGNQLATNNEHMLDVNNPRSVIFSNTSHK
ncbi:OBSCN [Mytilus coruscus]|uniref:OBSCN n=1 Tax=Mytilus coruscus TaxID=42192 RepID=A0A6J7ZW42_MYTCO|nr:OBSCN [Mytilus coruscus]